MPHPTSWSYISLLPCLMLLDIPSGLFPSLFTPKLCTHLSSPPYVLHTSPSQYSWFGHPTVIWWRIQAIKVFVMQIFSAHFSSFLLGPNTFIGALFSNTLNLYFTRHVRYQVLLQCVVNSINTCSSWPQHIFSVWFHILWFLLKLRYGRSVLLLQAEHITNI
jgi:hypothetical protein